MRGEHSKPVLEYSYRSMLEILQPLPMMPPLHFQNLAFDEHLLPASQATKCVRFFHLHSLLSIYLSIITHSCLDSALGKMDE